MSNELCDYCGYAEWRHKNPRFACIKQLDKILEAVSEYGAYAGDTAKDRISPDEASEIIKQIFEVK